uniref:Uncharacterized protein n=1 Tax=viral metagenome TaxID=1070528 RepID=A0A6H1ZE26_9ZZZZ
MTNYIVNEEELKNIFNMGINGEDFSFDDFLKSKQLVELVAEGDIEEVLEDFRSWVHEEHNKISHLEIMQGNLKMIKVFIVREIL